MYGIGIEEHDKEGRVITLEFEKFYMVTIYTPNAKRELERQIDSGYYERYMLSKEKLLPEPIPFLLEAFIGQTQNRAICGEFDNMAVIGKPWIVVVMQVCHFAIDGIEVTKLMPEEPAEMFVTVIGQKILTDEDCIALLSKYIFHNRIFGKFSFLAGEVVYKLGPNGAEVTTVCNDDLRIGGIYRWHNGFEYICCGRNPQLDIELCGLICHMFFLLIYRWVRSLCS